MRWYKGSCSHLKPCSTFWMLKESNNIKLLPFGLHSLLLPLEGDKGQDIEKHTVTGAVSILRIIHLEKEI